jgi:ABC-type polysaccharide/polyol phosphate transport system ATPase subunit
MIVQTSTAAKVAPETCAPVATVPAVSAILSEQRAPGQGDPVALPAAVAVSHVSKSFRLPHQKYSTLKERALHPFRSRTYDVLQAVHDVSVEIPSGEFFGIVGRNGSGKSTLLKCLAGIYRIDEGELAINGRLSPFIELGVGFNPELTARDNVIINAIMLGLSRKEARERFDDVIAFAELEEFVDLKLKNYSSGMFVRLAFATAVQVDADILLIDEVLAVGDAAFQQKCFDELTRLQQAGRTLLFVTHDMGAIQRFCNRAMLLERGRVVEIADPETIARRYNQLNFEPVRKERSLQRSSSTDTEEADLPQVAEVLNAWFESVPGEIAVTINQGEPSSVRMDVRFHEVVEDPIFSVTLQSENGQVAFSTNSELQRLATGRFDPGTTAAVRLRFENWLAPGRYRLFATVARAGFGADVLDAHITNSIIVLADRPGGGMADLPHTLEIERS